MCAGALNAKYVPLRSVKAVKAYETRSLLVEGAINAAVATTILARAMVMCRGKIIFEL